jgi:hypothetical protein
MMQNRSYRLIQREVFLGVAALLCLSCAVYAQAPRQTQSDDYTRYELLEPETQSFRIQYDVTATTAGAKVYYNAIRVGSKPPVHAVYDLMTGRELEWSIVDGSVAKQGGVTRANPEGSYIQVELARAVPEGGEGRIRIDKTYKDPESYFRKGDDIVFSRSLGIKRNAIVLPAGYELVKCNFPSQVVTETDGRVKVSFMNRGPAGVPFEVHARRLPSKKDEVGVSKNVESPDSPPSMTGRPSGARMDYRFSERAFQDREIVYFLQQPETHSFRLYHDYTESREGVDRYLNVVRAGSRATHPSARVLDTGETLKVETLRGQEIKSKGIDIGGEVSDETEVVVIWFEPVKKGQSVRLRIEETYTDPGRFLIAGEELIWDRSFGRSRNTVVLPEGWYVTTSSIPTVVGETDDGRIELDFVNDRPGNIDVYLKAKRR